MSPFGSMEIVVAVAISVLTAIFLASLVALIVVCRQKYCRKVDLITRQLKDTRPDVNLVDNMEGPQENPTDVELDDVGINANIEEILEDDTWVNDVTGLAPHCLAILKTCHMLTEKLVGMTMGNAQHLRSQEMLTDIVAIAKRISPRVDEVVRAMYPPLDPRLLEARCTALVLSVSHLVLVTKNACRLSGVLDWIDQSLADVEDHLRVLREASMSYESTPRSATSEQNLALPGNQDVNQAANQQAANQSVQQAVVQVQLSAHSPPQPRNDSSDV